MKEKKRKYKTYPNEQHRAERWSGGRIHRSKKVYTRKRKHKNKSYD